MEQLETRRLFAADTVFSEARDSSLLIEGESHGETTFTSPFSTFDVNDDGDVTALDALQTINWIGRNEGRTVPEAGETAPPYLDVSADGRVTSLDALRVINELSRESNRSAFELSSPGRVFEYASSLVQWEDPFGEDVSYRFAIANQADCRGGFLHQEVLPDTASVSLPSSIGTGEFHACLSIETSDGVLREPANNGIEFEVNGIHQVFATAGMTITTGQGQIPRSFGNIAGADFNCNDEAFAAGLIPDWDFASVIYQAVISDDTETAYDRLDIQGGLFNMRDERLAVDKDDFFDNELETPIMYTASGIEAPVDRFWHGNSNDGRNTTNFCDGWRPGGGSASVGATKRIAWIGGITGGGDCDNSGEALVCVSPLMPPLDAPVEPESESVNEDALATVGEAESELVPIAVPAIGPLPASGDQSNVLQQTEDRYQVLDQSMLALLSEGPIAPPTALAMEPFNAAQIAIDPTNQSDGSDEQDPADAFIKLFDSLLASEFTNA